MYLLFEGIDGCGKSTQIERLKEKFSDIIITKEPAGTKLGEKIRELILKEDISKEAETLLFLADRAEHYNRVIKPNRDKLIVSDRGFISGIAYALANEDFSLETLLFLNRFALNGEFPNFIFFFKIDRDTLKSRLTLRGGFDKIEKRGFEYLLRVQEKIEFTLNSLDIEYMKIDATLDVDIIHNQIVQKIEELINFNKNGDIITHTK